MEVVETSGHYFTLTLLFYSQIEIMKNIIYIFLLLAVTMACKSSQEEEFQRVTWKEDYQVYLSDDISTDAESQKLVAEMNFWQSKLEQQPQGFLYLEKLGRLWARRFEISGNVGDLHASDSLFVLASQKVGPKKKAANYHHLMRNAISRHDFHQARLWGEEALKLPTGKIGTMLMLFDTYLELGEIESAEEVLQQQRKSGSFDYLVRLSQFMDHRGDLDSAIVLFEEAITILDRYDNKKLLSWARYNLATMYGHDGRIQDSYHLYLDALNTDPKHYAALEGIAWIAYSHDRDPVEANRILNFVVTRRNDPAIFLRLAEIAEFQGETDRKKQYIDTFYTHAIRPEKNGLYHRPLILVEAEEFGHFSEAIECSFKEIRNRPTAQSYDLLAWSYYQRGDLTKALEIARSHVQGHSYEPVVVYHLGMIHAANGNRGMAEKFLSMAMEGSFELGPVTTAKIEQELGI